MYHSTGDKLDLTKRHMRGSQYDMLPPPDGGMWGRLQNQMKAKQKPVQNLRNSHSM